MTKRFKFRILRFIPCFRSCRTKHPSHSNSTLPSNPKQHRHSSLRRHVSSALISVACGLRSRPSLSDDRRGDYFWRKEDKWHVVDAKVHDDDDDDDTTPSRRKIYNSSASGGSGLDDDVLPLPSSKRRLKKKKTTAPRRRISTSSADHTFGLFSSDACDEEETEALVSSSRSFSTDSSVRETPRREEKKKKKKARRSGGSMAAGKNESSESSPEKASPARLSTLQRVVPWRESMAVVKKSENPYEDFRRSMLEMIVDKQMFKEKDLEELLCCFLCLNSGKHHGLIIQAFTDIWEALFCFCNAN